MTIFLSLINYLSSKLCQFKSAIAAQTRLFFLFSLFFKVRRHWKNKNCRFLGVFSYSVLARVDKTGLTSQSVVTKKELEYQYVKFCSRKVLLSWWKNVFGNTAGLSPIRLVVSAQGYNIRYLTNLRKKSRTKTKASCCVISMIFRWIGSCSSGRIGGCGGSGNLGGIQPVSD